MRLAFSGQVRGGKAVASLMALGLLTGAGTAIATSSQAMASGPYMNASMWMDVSPGGTPDYYLKSGTPVEMVCWTRGPMQDGTQKWFYIYSLNSPYPYGYVPANAVSNQISTPLCG